jgi:hypothetical protein
LHDFDHVTIWICESNGPAPWIVGHPTENAHAIDSKLRDERIHVLYIEGNRAAVQWAMFVMRDR